MTGTHKFFRKKPVLRWFFRREKQQNRRKRKMKNQTNIGKVLGVVSITVIGMAIAFWMTIPGAPNLRADVTTVTIGEGSTCSNTAVSSGGSSCDTWTLVGGTVCGGVCQVITYSGNCPTCLSQGSQTCGTNTYSITKFTQVMNCVTNSNGCGCPPQFTQPPTSTTITNCVPCS